MASSNGSAGVARISGHLELLYPSNYIKAADLRGKDVTVIIDHLQWEKLVMAGGKRDTKVAVVMRSVGGKLLERKWIVGKTVLRQIGHAMGTPDTTAWAGRPVTLYPTTCRGQKGETVECIRVRVKASRTQEEPPEEMTAPVEQRDFIDEIEGDGADGAAT